MYICSADGWAGVLMYEGPPWDSGDATGTFRVMNVGSMYTRRSRIAVKFNSSTARWIACDKRYCSVAVRGGSVIRIVAQPQACASTRPSRILPAQHRLSTPRIGLHRIFATKNAPHTGTTAM
jgi:hypothetical protein